MHRQILTEKEKASATDYEMLESIFGRDHFLFKNISADRIVLAEKDKQELQMLMDEEDYLAIKRFIEKFRK